MLSFVFKHQDNLANMYYLKGRNRNQIKSFHTVVPACHLNVRKNKTTPFNMLCKTILDVLASIPK